MKDKTTLIGVGLGLVGLFITAYVIGKGWKAGGGASA